LPAWQQVPLDVANAVNGVRGDPAEWPNGAYGALDHGRRKLRLGREGNVAGNVGGFQTNLIIGPTLRKKSARSMKA
jgi:hypothetical protein